MANSFIGGKPQITTFSPMARCSNVPWVQGMYGYLLYNLKQPKPWIPWDLELLILGASLPAWAFGMLDRKHEGVRVSGFGFGVGRVSI